MTPTTAALLERVHAAGVKLEANGGRLKWRAPTPLTANLITALLRHKAEILDALDDGPVSRLCQLQERIHRATDLQDLHAVVADADMAYVTGAITGDDVDSLCELARQEAQCLPEYAAEPPSKRDAER